MASGIDQIAPAGYVWAVTKSDSVKLAKTTRALWIGTTGDVRITSYDPATQNETQVTLVGVPDGTLLPICTQQVWSTGTTASNIVALA